MLCTVFFLWVKILVEKVEKVHFHRSRLHVHGASHDDLILDDVI